MLIRKSPSQSSRPTSTSESVGDNQSLKIAHRSGCLIVNLGTALGQRLYLWQMLVFPLVPIVFLVLQNSYTILQISRDHEVALVLEEEVGIIVEDSLLVSAVQRERTNLTLRMLSGGDYRRNENHTEVNNSSLLTSINHIILERVSELIRNNSGTTQVWRTLMTYHNMMLASEHILLSAVQRATSLAAGQSTTSIHDIIARQYLFSARLFRHLDPDFYQMYINFYNSSQPTSTNKSLKNSQVNRPDLEEAARFLESTAEFVNNMKYYQSQLIANISQQVAAWRSTRFRDQTLTVTLLSVILLVSVIIVLLVVHATHTIQTYANTLVRRTIQLRTEKRKSDCLLSQMLPLPVIRQLKQHKQVVAENYDSVTVYFSDIVGFTRISAKSSPMEVVNMLNSLYRLFDSRIQKYDVYKVETIGDSYMVVSGLPQKNGNKHAGEVATMSLDLLFSLQHFRIPHRPQEPLEVRVGLNTGPCVAGIVGTTMPRYCLFGDTINTASRMESTGEAMKIHMTSETKDYLELEGGFFMELRGQMEIKGKGEMNTYWLTGKEGGVGGSTEIEFTDGNTYIPEFLQIIGTPTQQDEELLP